MHRTVKRFKSEASAAPAVTDPHDDYEEEERGETTSVNLIPELDGDQSIR